MEPFLTDVSSDTLLEDYWELYWKYFKRNLKLSNLLPIFGPLIALSDFFQFKKHYQKVKEMRDNMREKELLKEFNAKKFSFIIENIYFYTLVDMKSFSVRKNLLFKLHELEESPGNPNKIRLITHYNQLVKRLPEKPKQEDNEVIPNEGSLLINYWYGLRIFIIFFSFLSFITFPPLVLIFLLPYFNVKKEYLSVRALKQNKNEQGLIEKIANARNSTFGADITMMCIYALADLKSDLLEETITDFFRKIHFFKIVLVKPDHMLRCNDLLFYIDYHKNTNQAITATKQKERLPVKKLRKLGEKKADSLPVTLVYFEDEEKINKEKCIITGLFVNVNKEEIVICPSCRRYVKKLLMEKWLKEKGSCPVCKESLNIQECPMVMIKSRKK